MLESSIKWLSEITLRCRHRMRVTWPWLGRLHPLSLLTGNIIIAIAMFAFVSSFDATPSRSMDIGLIGLTSFAIALLFVFWWVLTVERTRTELPRSHASCPNLPFSMVLIASGLLTSGYAGVCAAERAERAVVDRATLFRDANAVGAVTEIDGRSWIEFPSGSAVYSAMARDQIEFERVVARYGGSFDLRAISILREERNVKGDPRTVDTSSFYPYKTRERLTHLATAHQAYKQFPSISRQPIFIVLSFTGALLGVTVLALLSSVGLQMAFRCALAFGALIVLQSVFPLSAVIQATLQSIWYSLCSVVGLTAIICLQCLRGRRSIYSDAAVACMLWLPGLGCWLFLFIQHINFNGIWRMAPWITWHGIPVPQDDAHRGCFLIAVVFFLFSPLLGWLLEHYRRLPFAH